MDQTLINRIVEAALLATSQPLSLAQLRELFPEDQPAAPGAIEAAIEHLQADSANRGVELVEVASGFRFQVQADVHPWVARLWTERQTRYTRATLETLALIAYRQPITRGEIEQVRGVTVSSNIIKALEEREWIRVVGHRDVPGRPALFGTTKGFLDYFGLKRLDELPPLSELKDIGELEPQLQFDDAAGVAPPIAVAGMGDEAAADDDASDTSHVDDAANDDASDDADVANEAPVDTAEADDEDNGDSDADDDGDDLDFRSERPIQFDDSDVDDDEDENQISDAAEADVDPEAAPGERAVDENDHEQDNAVETTTVPDMTTASSDAAESNDNE
ncbi:SMC-Scp complex subunit ScpB [Lysobacter sp. TY2-98]|uniref:SMC-Scp complex subunit ScpB n=1 Tax=Lysobacter sp. TY2-98 TaxID=2290922 RepID=UPI000E209AE5|nr:SMC-Scp complex subunit ScpB [Lysobacter sp. TY2-98]AXK71751.1 SMC-Scp complex subunit ScpB [Lysobacter sp. TY2-98]